ncbi:MAG: RIP metalloprotease RseP [Crocinitomix sp.]|nr:RIP metalloprotease RseP [Crocinitomix sp.]
MLMIIQLILGLGLLVFLHELGHFLAARIFGMRVEKFVIFMDIFDFKLFKFTKGDTEYSIGWLPIGGYVKIAGMIDESLDKDQMKEEPKPDEFRSFAAWKRIIVLLGGVIVNLIVGLIIFTCVLYFGEKEYIPASELTEGMYVYEEGEAFGLQTGDRVTHLNGKEVIRVQDSYNKNIFSETALTIDRGGKTVEVVIPPTYKNRDILLYSESNFEAVVNGFTESSPAKDAGVLIGDRITAVDKFEVAAFGDVKNIMFNLVDGDTVNIEVMRNNQLKIITCFVDSTRFLGFSSLFPVKETEAYGVGSAMAYGYKESIDMLNVNIAGLAALFTGKIDFRKSVTGPIGIAKIYGSEFEAIRFWKITALISLILAITNLIPIPALDGGQIVIIMAETIIGRELSYRVKMVVQIVGIVLVLGLMLFTVINDIIRW